MTGTVTTAHIGLRFGDAAHQRFTVQQSDQIFPKKCPGDAYGISVVKITGEYCHFPPPMLQ
jgi:hypothetical protein